MARPSQYDRQSDDDDKKNKQTHTHTNTLCGKLLFQIINFKDNIYNSYKESSNYVPCLT